MGIIMFFRISNKSQDDFFYSYGHLLVITGYFYGIKKHSINGVF